MRAKMLILVFCAFLLNACSWIDAFYVINASDKPLAVEIILNKESPGIFKNDTLLLFEGEGKLDYNKRKEIAPVTLSDTWHYMIIVPAHATLQVGTMMNAPGSHYTQELTASPGFNLKELWIKRPGKEQKIIPATFNTFFKSGDLGRFDYKIKSF